jgi:hypothetical protein
MNLESLLGDFQSELQRRLDFASMPSLPQGGGGYLTAEGLGEYEDWQDQKVAIEIDLKSSEARVNAIESDIRRNELKYNREIEELKR